MIEGVGFEIQSDSIGSGFDPNVTNKVSGVPHDLVPSERERFYHQMLTGFRTCRLALGLYLRGLDAAKQHIRGRWPTQMAELAELQNSSGIAGFEVEYWSPPPYWKGPNQTYSCKGGGSTLRYGGPGADNASFIERMTTAMAADVTYLRAHGLRIRWWGLQNEPGVCPYYAGLHYTPTQYHRVYASAAPKILAAAPGVRLEGGAQQGCKGTASELFADPVASRLIDSWTYHYGGSPASRAMDTSWATDCAAAAAAAAAGPNGSSSSSSSGSGAAASVWTNEYEYFKTSLVPGDTANLAAYVINTFVFWNAPKFTWLHALKPTYNSEAPGFGLGFWRPYDDNSTQKVPLDKGHYRYNNGTWNAMAGFARHMPWNVRRVTVDEDEVRVQQRILAFITPPVGQGGPRHLETPSGCLGVVLVNLAQDSSFVANISRSSSGGASGGGCTSTVNATPGGVSDVFVGHRYNASVFDQQIGSISSNPDSAGIRGGLNAQRTLLSGGSGSAATFFTVVVPPLSIEFWLQY